MTETSSKLRRREVLWSSMAIGAFSATGWTYFDVGFVQSFLPLLIGIFALRRVLSLGTVEGTGSADLTERYDIDPDHDYPAEEQITILTEVEGGYSRKGRVWGALTALSAVVGIAAAPLSVALMAVCLTVAGYCLVRYLRVRRLRRHLGARIETLSHE